MHEDILSSCGTEAKIENKFATSSPDMPPIKQSHDLILASLSRCGSTVSNSKSPMATPFPTATNPNKGLIGRGSLDWFFAVGKMAVFYLRTSRAIFC
jgi:hypothetical protein